jgi:hypothetical protein
LPSAILQAASRMCANPNDGSSPQTYRMTSRGCCRHGKSIYFYQVFPQYSQAWLVARIPHGVRFFGVNQANRPSALPSAHNVRHTHKKLSVWLPALPSVKRYTPMVTHIWRAIQTKVRPFPYVYYTLFIRFFLESLFYVARCTLVLLCARARVYI